MKTEDRLELISKDLSHQIEQATDKRRRIVSQAVCEYIIAKVTLNHQLIGESLHALKVGNWGDQELLSRMEVLVADLDDEYFNLQEKSDEGIIDEHVYLDAFQKARAANAVFFALKRDSLEAARESIYEACAAVDDPQEIINTAFTSLRM